MTDAACGDTANPAVHLKLPGLHQVSGVYCGFQDNRPAHQKVLSVHPIPDRPGECRVFPVGDRTATSGHSDAEHAIHDVADFPPGCRSVMSGLTGQYHLNKN